MKQFMALFMNYSFNYQINTDLMIRFMLTICP